MHTQKTPSTARTRATTTTTRTTAERDILIICGSKGGKGVCRGKGGTQVCLHAKKKKKAPLLWILRVQTNELWCRLHLPSLPLAARSLERTIEKLRVRTSSADLIAGKSFVAAAINYSHLLIFNHFPHCQQVNSQNKEPSHNKRIYSINQVPRLQSSLPQGQKYKLSYIANHHVISARLSLWQQTIRCKLSTCTL